MSEDADKQNPQKKITIVDVITWLCIGFFCLGALYQLADVLFLGGGEFLAEQTSVQVGKADFAGYYFVFVYAVLRVGICVGGAFVCCLLKSLHEEGSMTTGAAIALEVLSVFLAGLLSRGVLWLALWYIFSGNYNYSDFLFVFFGLPLIFGGLAVIVFIACKILGAIIDFIQRLF